MWRQTLLLAKLLFIETATLSEDSDHLLYFEDSAMNDSSLGSGVQADLEVLETKDKTENSKKRDSAVRLHGNPFFVVELSMKVRKRYQIQMYPSQILEKKVKMNTMILLKMKLSILLLQLKKVLK